MHGNISEWCWDRYADYPDVPATDPTGPATGEERVVRGGCWANFGPKCRAANRESQNRPRPWT
jgi:formylglycine-generating enzyme required for sulfatase activity